MEAIMTADTEKQINRVRKAWLQAAVEICQEDGRTRGGEAKRGQKYLKKLDEDLNKRCNEILEVRER
jgi:hypothetical protein